MTHTGIDRATIVARPRFAKPSLFQGTARRPRDDHPSEYGRGRVTMGKDSRTRSSLPPEQLLDIAMLQLHPGRAAMVALAGVRRDLHFPQQRIHLGDRQDTAGADRAVARHGRRDMVQPLAQRQRLVERRWQRLHQLAVKSPRTSRSRLRVFTHVITP